MKSGRRGGLRARKPLVFLFFKRRLHVGFYNISQTVGRESHVQRIRVHSHSLKVFAIAKLINAVVIKLKHPKLRVLQYKVTNFYRKVFIRDLASSISK